MPLRPALRCCLVGTALLVGVAGAHPRPRPLPPAPVALGFAQTQRVLDAARQVVHSLRAGTVVAAGKGLQVVTLVARGQLVARVALWPDGTLTALPGGPVEAGPQPVTLTADRRARLDAQVAALSVSGAVEVTPGDYRVPLLSGGVVVAALRLDRVTLRPRPDGPGAPPRPRGPGG